MKLPALFNIIKPAKAKQDFFLALIFQQDKVSGILFQEIAKSLHILANKDQVLDVEEADLEMLITAADKVISSLELSLPDDTTVEKTIFAVPHPWVEQGSIIPERLAQLKRISQELALVPMGFIVSIEAIITFLKKKEGAPISSLFVELSDTKAFVYLVRGDKIIDIKKGTIDESVEKSVERLLETITVMDVLPPKIVLLHNKEAEAIQQKFLSHHWTKAIPFQHIPQVAILEKGFENEAIISGVASQMGFDISGDVVVSKAETVDENVSTSPPITSSGTFGFLKDEDVAQVKETVVEKVEEIEKEEPVVRIASERTQRDEEPEVQFMPETREEKSGGGIFSFFSSFSLLKRIFKNPFSGKGFKSYLIPIVAVVLVVGFTAAYYAFILKADVIIFTDKKEFKDSVDIALSTSDETSFDKKTLKIKTLEEEASGDESLNTTGKKETGDKAKGEVTIFNKTENTQSFPKGIKIKTSSGLEFVLSDAIEIASTSSFSTQFSNKKAKVEAGQFGKEYNLPTGANFTIANLSTSDVFGKNESAFAGGTKEEVQVVSDIDLTKLTEKLSEKLLEAAKKEAELKLSSNEEIISAVISEEFDEKKFDKKTGDEAKQVKLNGKIIFTLGVYDKEEFTKFIKSSSAFKVPDSFTLSDKESEIKLVDVKQVKDDISATLSFSAIYKPQLAVGDIPAKITGKSVGAAEKTLKSNTGISEVNIQFKNKIPFFPNILPMRKESIAIQVKAESL